MDRVYVLRMDDNGNPKRIIENTPKGKRTKSRSMKTKRRWIDCLNKDLRTTELSVHWKTEGWMTEIDS